MGLESGNLSQYECQFYRQNEGQSEHPAYQVFFFFLRKMHPVIFLEPELPSRRFNYEVQL
jgi:hypothetical protein